MEISWREVTKEYSPRGNWSLLPLPDCDDPEFEEESLLELWWRVRPTPRPTPNATARMMKSATKMINIRPQPPLRRFENRDLREWRLAFSLILAPGACQSRLYGGGVDSWPRATVGLLDDTDHLLA